MYLVVPTTMDGRTDPRIIEMNGMKFLYINTRLNLMSFFFINALYIQIGLVNEFRDETLDALKSYVKALAKYFPGKQGGSFNKL